jgi:hypothetical protein
MFAVSLTFGALQASAGAADVTGRLNLALLALLYAIVAGWYLYF